MVRTFLSIGFALLGLWPLLHVARAEESAAPRTFTEDELKAADTVRLALNVEDRALYNALRYLVRPAYEEEMFQGRRYRPSALPSMEERSVLPMGPLDHLRLWAVLQSGMPAGQAVENEITRLLVGVRPRSQQLPALAIEIATCRAAWLRKDSANQAALMARVVELYKLSRAQLDVTGLRSPYVTPAYIYACWFACHMWRAVILRCAIDMGVEVEVREWEDDLRILMRAGTKDGWTSSKQKVRTAAMDLHPNLMAMCALQLAAGAPEKVLSKGVATDISRKLAECPDVLARLVKDYEADGLVESHLLLVQTMGTLAPAKLDQAAWRDTLRRQGLALAESNGSFGGRNYLQQDLMINATTGRRSDRATAETALVMLALSGGLVAKGPGPLAGQGIAAVGRTLYALSVWHAGSSREQAQDFAGRVNGAIADGCEFLAQSQLADGSFPGMHHTSIGNHGACVLTLLHGGWDRKHVAVQKGLDYIIDSRKSPSGTYANAIVLMALQKYYEREQLNHGLLGAETLADFESARAKVYKAMTEPHRKLADELLVELEGARSSKGGYGYQGSGGRTSSLPAGSHVDNSCSQYAMLGFKAASMLGLRVNTSVFSDEATRLLNLYQPAVGATELEFEYLPDDRDADEKETKTRSRAQKRSGKITPGGWGYSPQYRDSQSLQMTAAGVSSLTICMDELKVRGKLGNDMAWRIALHVHGAQHLMAAQYYKPENFNTEGRSPLDRTGDGWGGFYNLYSVERACLLANIRTLGANVDWYRIGADALLDAQFEDGCWDGGTINLPGRDAKRSGATINTCMAILFLKQAAMPVITEHKKREKERAERDKPPVETPRSPITPGPEDKKKPQGEKPTPPDSGK